MKRSCALLGVFVALGCGCGGADGTKALVLAVTGCTPSAIPSEIPTTVTVTGSGFSSLSAVRIRIAVEEGRPFLGGRQDSLEVEGRIVSDTRLEVLDLVAQLVDAKRQTSLQANGFHCLEVDCVVLGSIPRVRSWPHYACPSCVRMR